MEEQMSLKWRRGQATGHRRRGFIRSGLGASEGFGQGSMMIRDVLLQEDGGGCLGGGLDGEELEVWFPCFLNGTVNQQTEPA